MKRLVAVLLPIALLLTLAACEGEGERNLQAVTSGLSLWDAMANTEVTGETITMKVGDTIQLKAMYEEPNTTDVTDLTDFTSSAPTAASVTNDLLQRGEIEAVAAGDAVITGDYKNKKGDHVKAKVTVHVEP